MSSEQIQIVQFSNTSATDRRLLKDFVNFHWDHYQDESRFVPILDYEFTGFPLLGIKGWLTPADLFFKHGRMSFFLAYKDNKIVGRVSAFINDNHNKHANDKVGFFGLFESIDDQKVTNLLLDSASKYLKENGMTEIRGPQNPPINESTPGTLIDGFDAYPIIYYHYNYPYYKELLANYKMEIVKKVVGMDVPVQTPVEERLTRIAEKVKKRYGITVEHFTKNNFDTLKKHMFEIYNQAWDSNWGFVPVTEEEFYNNLEDMKLIWDPKMFLFAYVKGEPAAFFGSVPNISDVLKPLPGFLKRWELIRAAKMLLTMKKIKSFRQGYFGIKPAFRKIGLDAVLISEAKKYTQNNNYQKCDIGWVLEDNELVLRIAEFMGGKISRTYAVFQKKI